VLLAAADTAIYGGIEVLRYTPTTSETGMLVVKLIAGHGTFTLGPPPVCGNGMKEAGEQCDDNKGCCTAQCTFQPDQTTCPTGICASGLCRAPVCGDSIVNAPETCDDGNAQSGDCCSSSCQKEADGSFCTGGKCADGKCVPNAGTGGGAGGGGSGGSGGGSQKKGCGCLAGGSEGVLALIAISALRLFSPKRRRIKATTRQR
jgi:cysteine-rich repeat protein